MIILSTQYCTQSSVIQRLGRCARKPNQPGVCIVGVVSKDDSGRDVSDDEEEEEDVSDEASGRGQSVDFLGHPQDYLEVRSGATPPVTRTPAMVLHGARQFVRCAHVLLAEPDVDPGKAAIATKAKQLLQSTAGQLGELISREHWTCSLAQLLTGYIDKEITMRSSSSESVKLEMTARGLGQTRTVSLWEANEYGEVIRRGRNRTLGRHELARYDAMRCFKEFHWNAQFLTPLGTRVIITDIELGHTAPPARERRWLKHLRGLHARRLMHGVDALPHHGTEGVFATVLRFDDSRALTLLPEESTARFKVGTVVCKREWYGFWYVNPITRARVLDFQSALRPQDWIHRLSDPTALIEGRALFQPTCWDTSGWTWCLRDVPAAFGSQDLPDREATLHLLAAELSLRASEILECPPQLMEWVVLICPRGAATCAIKRSVEDTWCPHEEEGDVETATSDAVGDPEVRVLMHEVAALGLGRESRRQLSSLLQEKTRFDRLQIGDPARREAMHDRFLQVRVEDMSDAENQKAAVVQCWNALCRQLAEDADADRDGDI